MTVLRRLRPLPLLGLALIWVLLWGRLEWFFVLTGLLLAALVLILFPLPTITSGIRVHPLRLLLLGGRFFGELVVASFQVAWKAIGPRPVGRGGIIRVQLSDPDALRRTLVAELTSLVPGTLVIDLDGETWEMIVHVLDHCDDARLEQERQRVLALEERVRRALGRDSHADAPARRTLDEEGTS